jgi:hypothetical protein
VASINVKTEEEMQQGGRGWQYLVEVVRDDGRTSEHRVRLSWADHEYWCGGRAAPSRVVEALMRFLVERESGGKEIPASFDAATARRWYPGVDEEIAGRV